VREERVGLEDETDAPLVGRAEDACRSVEPNLVVERDPPGGGPNEAGDRAQRRRLAGARRPDQGDRSPDVER
jgi:hypothetical protein